MDTTERADQLIRAGAEVEQEHGDAMAASRRALLRGGAGAVVGASAAALALGARTAGAQEDTTDSATTTTSPRRPQPDDIALLNFAQSLELAAVAAYQLVIDSELLDEDTAKIARLFLRHHQEHADAHGGLAGKDTISNPNTGLVELFSGRIERARSAEEALQVAFEIEGVAAATHVGAVGQYEGTEPASLAASIAPIEGRHGVVLGQALGLDIEDYTPEFQTTTDAVTAEQYPLEQE